MTNFVMIDSAQRLPALSVNTIATPRPARQMSAAVSAMGLPKEPPKPVQPSDRRWALRKRTEMPGYIAHSKNPQGVRCIVRNTSSSGALVEVVSGSDRFANPADEIPDQLTLVFISYRERTEVACAVMRRTGRMLGVRYVGSFRTRPAPVANTRISAAGKAPIKKR